MTTNERFIIGLILTILMASMSWSLSNTSVNSGRILVLESQMLDVKVDMKEHRIATETREK